MKKHLLVTGAAGFIGSNFVKIAIDNDYKVTVLDALTYAGHRANLSSFEGRTDFEFIHGRIEDSVLLNQLFSKNDFNAVLNFAAESHVDNSITGPRDFITTNIVGTFELLEVSRRFWSKGQKENFRFLHVSTDEVFGALGDEGKFSELTPYAPNSPYSASKAGSDLLVRAWHHTYGMPTITTNCSNNYGPQQFPEKLIPRMITQALRGESLPVYGQGTNIRDWIHVEDHCRGILLALEKGRVGESYCFGGSSERKNIDVVNRICEILDRKKPAKESYKKQIKFVEDRLGHDFRYAIDDSKAKKELGYKLKFSSFEEGLEKTIEWYLENEKWLNSIKERSHS